MPVDKKFQFVQRSLKVAVYTIFFLCFLLHPEYLYIFLTEPRWSPSSTEMCYEWPQVMNSSVPISFNLSESGILVVSVIRTELLHNI